MTEKKKEKKESSSSSKTTKSASPSTMEELLNEAGVIRTIRRGQKIEGTISQILSKEMLINIGGKSEGVVLGREFEAIRDLARDFKPGEKVLATVTMPEDENGQTILSLRHLASKKRWDLLLAAKKADEPIEVTGMETIKGGILVDFRGLRGFIPGTFLDPDETVSGLVGKRIKVKILELDPSLNRLVLSQKAVTRQKSIKKALDEIKRGDIKEGVVSGLAPFGAFVKVGDLDGLVHISEIAWEKVDKPQDYFQIGKTIKVKILDIDKSSARLNLSVKQLTDDPWAKTTEKYQENKNIKGKVQQLTDYGILVTLEPGIEGLIHNSKIPSGFIAKEGEGIECVIEKVDKKKRKISLVPVLKEKPVGYR